MELEKLIEVAFSKHREEVTSTIDKVLREAKAELDKHVEQAAAAIRSDVEQKIGDLHRSQPADARGHVENVKDLRVEENGILEERKLERQSAEDQMSKIASRLADLEVLYVRIQGEVRDAKTRLRRL